MSHPAPSSTPAGTTSGAFSPPGAGKPRRALSGQPDQRQLGRKFFLAALLLAGAAFLYMVRGFLISILLATVFTTLFYPLFLKLTGAFGGRRGWASLVTCLLIILLVLGPVWLVTALVAQQVVDLYASASQKAASIYARSDTLLGDLYQAPWFRGLGLDQVDWAAKAQEAAQFTGKAAAGIVNKTASGTLTFIVHAAIMLFTMFYFFVDGESLVARLKYLSPLDERHEDAIAHRFASVSRATVKGTVAIAAVQTVLGTVLLWLCGVDAPLVWGVVMFFLAFIPIVGVKLVLLPAGLFQLLTGHVTEGLIIIVLSFVVILNVDNILRPRLVGKESQMHDLLIFFATIGGLATFGIPGLIVGPVLAAFFLSLLEIYGTEFRDELENAHPTVPEPPPIPSQEAQKKDELEAGAAI